MTLFVFPSTYTLVMHTIIGRIFSTFPSLSNAVLDYEPLRQCSSLFGLIFIEFVVAYICSLVFHFMLSLPGPKSNLKRVCTYTMIFCVMLFTTTGFINVGSRFYQKNVSALITPYTTMSCIFSQSAVNGTDSWDEVWTQTESRLSAGDSLVMWSEEAFVVFNGKEESEVISKASSLAARYRSGYIGVTYKRIRDSLATNQFVLITSDGDVAWNYHKAMPVPFIEADVIAGPENLPIYDPVDGPLSGIRLGGSICFDMDYPSYIQQGSFKHVDLMLQPSWTWNALDKRHFDGDAVRTVGQ